MKRRMNFDGPMAKISRRGLTTLQRGQVAGYRFNKLHPWSSWGAARIPRGTPWSLSNYGSSYKSASDEQKNNRKLTGFTGRGAYGIRKSVGGFLKKQKTAQVVYDKVMNAVGLGPATATPVAGSGLYTGRGLYGANNLMDGGRPSMKFSSANDETQSLTLSHKEYVSDVFAPATSKFSNTSYALNPGLQQNFPFLAQFANNFDEYELIQMVFEFHSTVDSSATNNATGNTGTLIMATNYKSDAQPFATKEEMIQYHGGVSGRLTEALVHGVECDPSKNAMGGSKFIRTGPVANSDIKTYDSGVFQLAIQNCPSPFFNSQIGELWVTYTVKLSKPKLNSANGNFRLSSRWLTYGGETGASPLGTELLAAQGNNINCNFTPATKGFTMVFPASLSGVFEVKIATEGVGMYTSGASYDVGVGSNITDWTDMYATDYTSGSGVGDNPGTTRFLMNGTTGCFLLHRFRLQSASGGVDNSITFYPIGKAATSGSITQMSIELDEIGNMFARSNTNSTPIYVNSVGVIRDPPAIYV